MFLKQNPAMKNTQDILLYMVIIASIVLLILNISRLDFNNLSNGKYAGIISNILLIIAMSFVISGNRKKNKKH